MTRFTIGFIAGIVTVFTIDAVVYEVKKERRKRQHERLPFTKWETQDWDEEADWDTIDEWLAGS